MKSKTLKKSDIDTVVAPARATKAFYERAPDEMVFECLGMVTCLHQIKSADIALQRSQRADVQHFARQMQNDYQALAEKFMAFGGGLSTPHAPSQNIDLIHRCLIEDLEESTGEMFDEKYIEQQEAAVSAALAMFDRYGENGKAAHLRNLAQICRPVLQTHLEMVGEFSKDKSGSGA